MRKKSASDIHPSIKKNPTASEKRVLRPEGTVFVFYVPIIFDMLAQFNGQMRSYIQTK